MFSLLTAVSAVVPSLLLMAYFHRRDVFREPARDLWMVFGAGILIVVPVIGIARPIDPLIDEIASPNLFGLASAFLQAAVPEELFKFVVLWFFATRRLAFDEPMDGVVYGVAASLGFATFENIVYVTNSGPGVAVMRAFTAVPSHAFLGAIMGYFVGRARFEAAGRARRLTLALIVPTLLHGLYDWPLMVAGRLSSQGVDPEPWSVALLSIAPLTVVAEWILAVRLSRRLRVAQLRELPEGWRVGTAERWSSILLAVAGGVLATLGALVSLGTLWLVLSDRLGGEPVGRALATGTVLGATPALIGVALFLWGVRRLNESGRRI